MLSAESMADLAYEKALPDRDRDFGSMVCIDRQFFLLNTLMVGVDKLRKGTTKVPIDPKRPA